MTDSRTICDKCQGRGQVSTPEPDVSPDIDALSNLPNEALAALAEARIRLEDAFREWGAELFDKGLAIRSLEEQLEKVRSLAQAHAAVVEEDNSYDHCSCFDDILAALGEGE